MLQVSRQQHDAERRMVEGWKKDATEAVLRGERIEDYANANFFLLEAWAAAGDDQAAAEIRRRRGGR